MILALALHVQDAVTSPANAQKCKTGLSGELKQ